MTNTRLLRLAGPIGLGVVPVASLAAATVGSSPYDPDTGAPVLAPVTDQLSAEASAQMKALGPSVHVVECAPGLSEATRRAEAKSTIGICGHAPRIRRPQRRPLRHGHRSPGRIQNPRVPTEHPRSDIHGAGNRARPGCGFLVGLFVAACACTMAAPQPQPRPIDEPLPSAVREELASIAPGAYVIQCSPGVNKLPDGITVNRPLAWPRTHPGYLVLSDGHCAFDPSAMGVPISPEPVEGH